MYRQMSLARFVYSKINTEIPSATSQNNSPIFSSIDCVLSPTKQEWSKIVSKKNIFAIRVRHTFGAGFSDGIFVHFISFYRTNKFLFSSNINKKKTGSRVRCWRRQRVWRLKQTSEENRNIVLAIFIRKYKEFVECVASPSSTLCAAPSSWS